MRRLLRLAGAGLIAVSALAAAAEGPRLALLDAIQPGAWQLHEGGTRTSGRTICVRDPGLLLQVAHGSSACTRFVLAQAPRSATIHYTCPGLGNGRTIITLEGPGQARLQTQGISHGAPFDFDYAARRTGAC